MPPRSCAVCLSSNVFKVAAPVEDARESSDVIDGGRLSKAERKCARIGALVGVLFFVMLATWGQPWRMFDTGPFSSDFYDVQARSMVHGHMDVPRDVAQIEGFVVNGDVQIYFGVGPALIRVPFAGWTEFFDRRLGVLSMSIACGVLGLAAARLLKRSRAFVDRAPPGKPWWFAVMAAGAIVCTPVLFLASRSVVYHEALIWGCAAGLAGLDLVLRWWREPTRRHFVEAVALATFAMSCRPTSGMSPAIALGLFGLVLTWRREWARAALAVGAAFFALLGFVVFNWLRFRSFFSQPYPDQIWTQANDARKEFLQSHGGSLLGLEFLPTTILRYFSPTAIGFQRLFPFVNFGSSASPMGNTEFESIYQSSSLLLGAPVLSLLGFVGVWWTAFRDRARAWTIIAIASVAATVSTFAFASIAQRYLVDLIPAVVVLACPAVWLVSRWLSKWTRSKRRVVLASMVILSMFGTWAQISFAVETRAFSIYAMPIEANTHALVSFQNGLDNWLFDGPPPQLQRLTGESLPTEGQSTNTLAILDDCGGLYHYDGFGWQVVERKPGGGRRFIVTGEITDERQPILRGWQWTLTAQRTSDGVVLVYDAVNGRYEESQPIQIPEGLVTFDVVADQAQTSTVSVRYGNDVLLLAYYVGIQYPEPAPGWNSTPGSAPLCESLLSRIKE